MDKGIAKLLIMFVLPGNGPLKSKGSGKSWRFPALVKSGNIPSVSKASRVSPSQPWAQQSLHDALRSVVYWASHSLRITTDKPRSEKGASSVAVRDRSRLSPSGSDLYHDG